MGKVIRPFCWHKNVVPWGLSAPNPGLYTCIKSWKKLYKIKTSKTFFLNLQQIIEVTRHFCWHQNFGPLKAVCPCLGVMYMYKIMKKKIFFKLATNDRSDKIFLLTSKFRPRGVVSACPGAIYVYKIMKKKWIKSDFKEIFLKVFENHEKNGIKLDFWEIVLKLATNDRSNKMFLLTSKFRPQGVICPCPAALYMYKIMKKLYKIRLQRDFFETCSKWPKWQQVSVDIKILSPEVVCPWPAAIYIY